MARKLWEYLTKKEDVREMFIINLFSDKVCLCYVCVHVCMYVLLLLMLCKAQLTYPLVLPYFSQNISNTQDMSSTILYKDIDTEVSTFCLNSVTMIISSEEGLILC